MSTTESTKPKKLFDDEPEDLDQPRSLMPVLILLLVFAAVGGVVLLVQFFREDAPPTRLVDLHERIREANERPLTDTPMMLPGLVKPPAFPPEEAFTDDSKQVIGITVGKKHRAYLLDSFRPLGMRVVNDVVEDVPITVLYDPQKDLLRVLTSDTKGEHLGINLGGYLQGDMFVMIGDREFKLKNPFPFADYPYARMLWKEWRERHPDTDIYTGRDIVIPFGNPELDRLELNDMVDDDPPAKKKKAADKKAEDKKADDKKADDKKAEDKKAEDKKADDKKVEVNKGLEKKVDVAKPDAKKAVEKKAERPLDAKKSSEGVSNKDAAK